MYVLRIYGEFDKFTAIIFNYEITGLHESSIYQIFGEASALIWVLDFRKLPPRSRASTTRITILNICI